MTYLIIALFGGSNLLLGLMAYSNYKRSTNAEARAVRGEDE
jgi:hypothetical protein